MNTKRVEVWAQIHLSLKSQEDIRNFFVEEMGIKARYVTRNMHITIYHSRRALPGLVATDEKINLGIPSVDMRSMVMAPGGENPLPGIEPGRRKIGLRVHRQSPGRKEISRLREMLATYETKEILGNRTPSTNKHNAFGSRYFQPHMSILRRGSRINSNLKLIGVPFREVIGDLRFDRFSVEIKEKTINIRENA